MIKIPKKAKQKICPYKNTIIEIGSGKPIYFCHLFADQKECIFGGYSFDYEEAGECSYYLFPEENFFILGLNKLSNQFKRIIYWRNIN